MDLPPSSDADEPNVLYGIGLKILAVVIFVGMHTAIKAGAEGIPPGQIVFFRSFFALVPVVVYLLWLGSLSTALQTEDFANHLLRGLVGVTAMSLGFYALTRLPYPEWITISYGAPLLSVVFAAIFLKEVVRAYRWFAVLVGLCGIAVVSLPNFTVARESFDSDYAIGALAALGGAFVSAIATIQIRRLVRYEATATIVIYFSLTSSALALLTIPFGWVWMTSEQAFLLIAAGLCGGIGQLLMTACYRYADTSTIAPFEYISLILAVLIGYFLFGESVTINTLLGAVIVVASGIFIIYREHQLGIERAKARRVTPPQG